MTSVCMYVCMCVADHQPRNRCQRRQDSCEFHVVILLHLRFGGERRTSPPQMWSGGTSMPPEFLLVMCIFAVNF